MQRQRPIKLPFYFDRLSSEPMNGGVFFFCYCCSHGIAEIHSSKTDLYLITKIWSGDMGFNKRTEISQDARIFIQMAVYYFIITNVRYGTTTSDTTCTRINNDCSG